MPGFSVWNVVRVPFPYSNRPIVQRRPALVVGARNWAGGPPLLWLLMITSATHRHWEGDVEILDLEAAGLPAPSMVRCARITTVEIRDIDPLGALHHGQRPMIRGQVLAGLHVTLQGQGSALDPLKAEP